MHPGLTSEPKKKKLALKRETIRRLDDRLLADVRGGMDATNTCPTWGVVTTVAAPVTQKLGCELT